LRLDDRLIWSIELNICVIGTGYVGLVTGAVLSDLGNNVFCVDNVESKIAMLRRGEMPIYEPGLDELVARNVRDGRLCFTGDLGQSVSRSSVVFICVGTPPLPSGEPDMTFIKEAALGIARSMNNYKVIVNKSTVPVGTGELVREIILSARRSDVDFDVVSNPEFLREGSAIQDTRNPDRIIIGASNKKAAERLSELYAPLDKPIQITDVVSAEVIKYASNAFLATKISFMNAIAELCDATGADVTEVADGMGRDIRIGAAFLHAGLGFGGSCFPKDTRALIQTAEQFGCPSDLLSSVVEINDTQTERFMNRLELSLNGFQDKTVGVLGLAFKPNTDDMRDAKSIEVVNRLISGGAQVRAYDPVASLKACEVLPEIKICESAYAAARGAHAIVVVTEWSEFIHLDLARIRAEMVGDLIFDGRNIFEPKDVVNHGFRYYGVGRGYHGRLSDLSPPVAPEKTVRPSGQINYVIEPIGRG